MTIERYITQTIQALLDSPAHVATKYLSSTLTIRVARRRFRHAPRRRPVIDLVVTIGRPNYAGRRFVKACLAAGEPFPVKRVQLTGSQTPTRKTIAA